MAASMKLPNALRLLLNPVCKLTMQYAVIVTNQSFAGHLGANELAAAAIAVTVRLIDHKSAKLCVCH